MDEHDGECADLQSDVTTPRHADAEQAKAYARIAATPKVGDAPPRRCKGMFARDPALRTACRPGRVKPVRIPNR